MALRESLQTATLARPIITEVMIEGSDLVLAGEMFDGNSSHLFAKRLVEAYIMQVISFPLPNKVRN